VFSQNLVLLLIEDIKITFVHIGTVNSYLRGLFSFVVAKDNSGIFSDVKAICSDYETEHASGSVVAFW
jgi:hypothetical protein